MPPKPEDKGKAKAANRQRTRNVTPAVDPDSLKQHVSMPTTHDYRSQSTHTPLPYSTPVINYQANPRPAVTFSLPAHTPPSYRAPFITHPPYPRPTATFPLPIHTQSPYSTPFTTSPATATFPLPKNTPPVNSSTPFPKNTAPPMYTHPYIPEDKGKAKVTNRQRTRNVMPIVDRDSLEHVSMPTTRDHRSRSTHTPLPYSTPFTTNPANPRPAATFPLPAHTPPSYSAPSTTYPPYPRPTTTFPLPTRTQSPYSTPFMTSPATVTFPLPKNTPPVYSSTQFPKDTTPPMYTHSQVPGYRPFLPGPRPHPSGSFQNILSPSEPAPYVHQYPAQLEKQQQQEQLDQQEKEEEPEELENRKVVTRLPCGRFVIYPSGNSFVLYGVAKKFIKLTIKANYKKFWPSYDKISKDDKKELFNWFTTKCTWEMRHNAQIERNFHHKAAAYLTDLLMEERTKFAKSGGTRRPRWISDEIWRRLVNHWAIDYVFKGQYLLSEKKKRASEKGGCLHTGESENQPDRNPHIRRETNTYVDSHSEDSEISFDRNGRKILHVSDTSLSSSSASMDSASLIDVAQPLKREGRSLYQQIAEGEGSSHLPKLTPEIVELIQQMSDLLVQSQSLVLQQSKARMQQEQEFREQQQLMMDEIQRQKTVYQGLVDIVRHYPLFEQDSRYDESFSEEDEEDYDDEEEDEEDDLLEEDWLRRVMDA
ncbi:hypothetical protein TSUD_10510 [Trifolium subterraneum]|nr:hypothetical protein TSUD_10510 [Trifolium subterraneum]